MNTSNNLYILSNGRVAAIDKTSGEIVWEVKLRTYVKTSLNYTIGQITFEHNKLFVAVSGILLCLEATDGSLIWKNELKGWGYNFVSVANAGIDATAAGNAHTQAVNTAVAASAIAVVATSSGK